MVPGRVPVRECPVHLVYLGGLVADLGIGGIIHLGKTCGMRNTEPTAQYWRKASFTHFYYARRFLTRLTEQGYRTHSGKSPAMTWKKGFWGFHYGPDKEGVLRIEYTETPRVWAQYRGISINHKINLKDGTERSG